MCKFVDLLLNFLKGFKLTLHLTTEVNEEIIDFVIVIIIIDKSTTFI